MGTEGEKLQRVMRLISPFNTLYLKCLYLTGGITAVSQAIQSQPLPVTALRCFGARIGEDTVVYPRLTVHGAQKDFSNLRIGSGVRIVRDCLIDLSDPVEIEDNVIVSFGCKIITHRNIYKSPLAEKYPPEQKPVRISRGAVLFTDVTVLMGVTIGECSMVAAGSIVTRDVPPWTLVGGCPARHLKTLTKALDDQSSQCSS